MPKVYECSFCGGEVLPGTGSIYIRRDGRILRFCSSKCRKSMINLKRDPRKFKWTKTYKQRQR